jgi:rhodanese-related sulfurtransferase
MPTTIETEELRVLLQSPGAVQLIEVLPPAEFAPEHLPGARNLPLTELTRSRARELDPSKPVVVYCFDFQ